MEKLPKKVQREVKFLLDWDSITVNKVREHLYEVFGVSGSVTLLQEKFFARNQLKDEDVMLYSHVLVDLARQIEQKCPGKLGEKAMVLKQRLSEGVLNKELSRELHRLIKESPNQSFTYFRTGAIEWLVYEKRQTKGVANLFFGSEGVETGKSLFGLLENQQKQLDNQQHQLELLSTKFDAFMAGSGIGAKGGHFAGQFCDTRFCKYCNKKGHVQDNCFSYKKRQDSGSQENYYSYDKGPVCAQVARPSGQRFRPGGQGPRSDRNCTFCKKPGHSEDRCFLKKKVMSNSIEGEVEDGNYE